MHSFIALSVLSALTASVSAIPYAAHQAHHHLHARKNFLKLDDVTPIAGRDESLPIAPFGQCGGDSGFGCAEGFCCSQWGYCGKSQDYCGTGCQFGACFGNSSLPVASGSAPVGTASANDSTISIAFATKDHGNGPPAGYTNSPVQTVDTSDKGVPTSAPAAPTFSGPAPAQYTTFVTQYATVSSAEAPASNSAPAYSPPAPPAYSAPESSEAPVTTSAPAPVSPVNSAPESSTAAAPTTYSAPAYTPPASSSEAAPTTAAPTSEAPSSSAPAAPSYSAPSGGSSGGSGFGDSYKMYTGDGTTGAGWPTESDWASYDDAWNANMKDISVSCSQFGVDNNSDEESSNLKSAISSVAQESGIDERFILAVVMQESKGCVRAPTTTYSVRNPGLMQSHNGKGTCNDASNGGVQNPCPMEQITQQIKDGVMGTSDVSGGGDGLQQTIQQAGCSDVSKYYKGARIYNSGSISGNDLGAGVATHCYAADVANRLTGWVTSECLCTLDGGS